MSKQFCPCHSGKLYQECCQPYHSGQLPENALILMRSRYAAYALELPEYIITTTHSRHPAYSSLLEHWEQEILLFSCMTKFSDLTIHDFIDGVKEAYVTFTAHLQQNGLDVSPWPPTAFSCGVRRCAVATNSARQL